MKHVLGLDIGGSSVKGWLSGEGLDRCAQITLPLPLHFEPENGLAEFDPQEWWLIVGKVIQEILAIRRGTKPAALVVSSIRQAFVLCSDVGELGMGIHNADRRGASAIPHIDGLLDSSHLYDLTGHWFAPQLPLPKLVSIRQYETERWRRITKLMFVHDWIVWRLSGVWRNEKTLATSSQLCEVKSRNWSQQLMDLFLLKEEMFGELVQAGEIVGEVTNKELPDLYGVPIVAGGGDAHFLAHGSRSRSSDIVAVAGSTTPIQAISNNLPADSGRRPWISSPLVGPGWAVEVNAGYTGAALDWICARLQWSLPEALKAAWTASDLGARGVIALTASPRWDRESWIRPLPFSFARLNPGHKSSDLVRAVVEAHAYAIRANLESLEDVLSQRTGHLILTGGWVADSNFSQLLADVTQRIIWSITSFDASVRTSTLLANESIPGIEPHKAEVEIYEPCSKDSRYSDNYREYCQLYQHSILNAPI